MLCRVSVFASVIHRTSDTLCVCMAWKRRWLQPSWLTPCINTGASGTASRGEHLSDTTDMIMYDHDILSIAWLWARAAVGSSNMTHAQGPALLLHVEDRCGWHSEAHNQPLTYACRDGCLLH